MYTLMQQLGGMNATNLAAGQALELGSLTSFVHASQRQRDKMGTSSAVALQQHEEEQYGTLGSALSSIMTMTHGDMLMAALREGSVSNDGREGGA